MPLDESPPGLMRQIRNLERRIRDLEARAPGMTVRQVSGSAPQSIPSGSSWTLLAGFAQSTADQLASRGGGGTVLAPAASGFTVPPGSVWSISAGVSWKAPPAASQYALGLSSDPTVQPDDTWSNGRPTTTASVATMGQIITAAGFLAAGGSICLWVRQQSGTGAAVDVTTRRITITRQG